jgi:hypothetical protein
MATMLTHLSEVIVTVFGKNVADSRLQMASMVLFFPCFFGALALVLTAKMVAKDQHWVEPGMFSFRNRIPPFQILTSAGKKLRVAGYTLLAVGFAGFFVIYVLVSRS